MDSFPAYIEAVGWTVWPRGSIPRKQCARFQQQGSIQFWAHDTLPDKKLSVFILDRLQKCATLLPDYHEVIEHPMDFGTVPNKLSLRIKPMSNEQRRQGVNSRMTEFVPLLITTSLLASRIELPLRHGSLRPPGR
ncbi:unnamed protein product [Musa hybrid cultivar]